MGYPTKVQLIQRKASRQWYVNFPAALAEALEFDKGEVVEWVIQDHRTLELQRTGRREAAGGKKNARAPARIQSPLGRLHGRLRPTTDLGSYHWRISSRSNIVSRGHFCDCVRLPYVSPHVLDQNNGSEKRRDYHNNSQREQGITSVCNPPKADRRRR